MAKLESLVYCLYGTCRVFSPLRSLPIFSFFFPALLWTFLHAHILFLIHHSLLLPFLFHFLLIPLFVSFYSPFSFSSIISHYSLNTSLQFPPLPKHNRLSHRHYIYIYSRVWESIVFCVLVCFVYCVLSIVFCMWESVVSTCSRCWAIVFMSLSRRWLSCKEQWPKLQYWKDACSRDG